MTRRTLALLGASAALAVTATWFVSRTAASEPGTVVARVNGVAITEPELAARLDSILPMASFHGNVAADRLIGLKRTALDELILDALIFAEASDRGASASDAAVDAELAAVQARFASDEEFHGALREHGLSIAAFRERLARTIVVRDARAAATAVSISEDDLRAYFEANRAKFTRPPQVRLHEILIKVDPAGGDAARRAAGTKARQVLSQLAGGADFGAVAREISDDAYRVKDGDLGWVHAGRLDADIEAAVFAAPVGSIRRYESLHGVHIFRVDARADATPLTFDEARTVIEGRLQIERREARVRAWHDTLKRGAAIEILDATLREATPATLPKLPLAPSGA